MKPNPELWARINAILAGENAAESFVTLLAGMTSLLVATGVSPDDSAARVHLAAMLLSPDGAPVGSLLPALGAELRRLTLHSYNPS